MNKLNTSYKYVFAPIVVPYVYWLTTLQNTPKHTPKHPWTSPNYPSKHSPKTSNKNNYKKLKINDINQSLRLHVSSLCVCSFLCSLLVQVFPDWCLGFLIIFIACLVSLSMCALFSSWWSMVDCWNLPMCVWCVYLREICWSTFGTCIFFLQGTWIWGQTMPELIARRDKNKRN